MNKKKIAKIVVNSLTLSRIAGTICLPFVFNMCTASIFIIFIAAILFTDFLDGALARKFDVSTLFGSLVDMTADKVFGISLIITLSTMYPLMTIPLAFETLIAGVNINAVKNGGLAQSSQIGRIKMWITGISICLLFITGLTPEIIRDLNNINVKEANSIFQNFFNNLGKNYDPDLRKTITEVGTNLNETIKNIKVSTQTISINALKKVEENKENIEISSHIFTILSELYVLKDYILKNLKIKENKKTNKEIIEELKNNKEYIKKIMFDETFYKETKEQPLIKKLTNKVDKN